ncbi:MAG: chemotaxis protein CheW [Oscillospiraceae bacterium]|jgi:purine-binding chemotaxis protein CheW|nr:chemotaxis protein CheW [Oscillospiraceae bacterium]
MDQDNLTLIDEEDGTRDRYLTFAVGDEDYGVEIAYVTEIINVQTITELPELPPYIRGIINLRGKIVPVMDVRIRFNKEPKEYTDRTCIIVVDIGDSGIGLIVDQVREVLEISAEQIVPPSESRSSGGNRYISGIAKTGEDIKLLIDIERLVSDELAPGTEN